MALALCTTLSACYLKYESPVDEANSLAALSSVYDTPDYGIRFLPLERVEKLPPPILVTTPEVERELARFSGRERNFVAQSWSRRKDVYPVLKQIFEDEGVPEILINVACIESGFKDRAYSHHGATGMWQFMKSTGRIYGLKIGFFEDQRKDSVLATIAAARHLRDLYLRYRDWPLALAAYNAGPGSVDRAIRRAGGNRDFWVLARRGYFRRETAAFVPRFVAVSLIAQKPEAYGFSIE
jgi:membrane-bound lytic murein transglycosylase D